MSHFSHQLATTASTASGNAERSRSTGIWQKQAWLALLAIGVATSELIQSELVRADTPATAPTELKATLSAIDTAANKRDVQAILKFYSSNLIHSDGLTRSTLGQALTQLWQRYPNLTYQTELKSWKREGNRIIAETATTIAGSQKLGDRDLKLNSTLQARQQFENQTIVQQDILAERSQITTGAKPPTVILNLPAQVNAGQEFSFDAVVQEPLGDDLLLGAATEEPVQANSFVNPTVAELQLLSSGGIFKVGRAPAKAESRWISAILVRQDGMTIVTQRLRVVGTQSAK